MRWALLLLCVILPGLAQAALPRATLDGVGVRLPAQARLDMRLAAPDIGGKRRSLGDIAEGRPVFVNFVDYTCNTLCGTDLMLLADGIRRAGLKPADLRIIVLGLDPKDSAAVARKMHDAEIPPDLRAASAFLLPDAATVAKATGALGFHYAYDAATDQFAHPAAVYALAPDGSVRAVLSPLALTAGDLRTALSGAEPPALGRRILALCYGLGAAVGLHTRPILLALKAAGVATLLMLGLAMLLFRRRRAKP